MPGKTRVFGASQGAFGERLAADWRTLIQVPEGMSYEAASTLFITYPTSYAALVTRAKLQKDEVGCACCRHCLQARVSSRSLTSPLLAILTPQWCLVHAGAGGVGLCAVQIAKGECRASARPGQRVRARSTHLSPSVALGAKVIATAGSAEKLRVCKEKGGADFALDYTKPDWQKEVLKITGGKGANVIYDPVGMIQPSLKCIAWNGRAVVVGFAAGSIEKVCACQATFTVSCGTD